MQFPAIGQVYEANYSDDYIFHLHFESNTSMTLVGLTGKFKGVNEKLNISVVLIRPNVFLISWQESNKTTVTEVQDFENGIVYANATMPDQTFERLKGTLKRLS